MRRIPAASAIRSEHGDCDSFADTGRPYPDHAMTDHSSADRPLLPVADQHLAARGRKFRAILLEASQNGKIALIHQVAAETLHVARASFLLLIRAAMG